MFQGEPLVCKGRVMWVSQIHHYISRICYWTQRHCNGPDQGSGCPELAHTQNCKATTEVIIKKIFYWRFIWNFSSLAFPLNFFLCGKPHKLQWSEDAQHALMDLKHWFTSAPILKQPDPELPFMVEVDASESGIGAILSQCQEPQTFPLCILFSQTDAIMMWAIVNY